MIPLFVFSGKEKQNEWEERKVAEKTMMMMMVIQKYLCKTSYL